MKKQKHSNFKEKKIIDKKTEINTRKKEAIQTNKN
jgi:hypothetical protein